jgi:hypothetical protein
MSNRNFDASLVAKRLRDTNVAQQIYSAMQNGTPIGNPLTINAQVSTIPQFNVGIETTVEKGLNGGYSFNLGGIANYVTIPDQPSETIPDAPVIISGTSGNLSAIIDFTAPASDGNSPLIRYEYSLTNGNTWTAFSPAIPTSPVTITGLSLGFNYIIAIRAVNAIGESPSSNIVTVEGRTTPGAPTSLVGTSASGQVSIAFTPGTTGNSAITDYKYSINNGSYISAVTTSSPITITGLTNGTTYSFKIKAVNAIGDGAESSSVLITPLPGSGLVLFLDAANYTSGSLWPESSGKSKNATLYNSPTWSSANGGIFTFNGTNQYASIPTETVNFSSGITILSFVDFGVVSNWERIIDFGNGPTSNNILLARQSTTDNIVYEMYQNSTQAFTNTLSNGITNSAWGFYGSKADGTNYKIFSQENSATGSSSVLPLTVSRANNYIARSNWSGDAFFERYMGIIAIYNTALSDSDIASFYNLFKSRYSLGTIVTTSFTTVGTTTWTAPVGTASVEYLVVGGGGGGGGGYDNGGGGGGGGGMVLTGTLSITPGQTYSITVGNGGLASTNNYPSPPSETEGGTGGNSIFASITALGGRGGKGSRTQTGGSGLGGAAAINTTEASVGGNGGGAGGGGGGGGGASGAGTNKVGSTAGIGGTGTSSIISGSSITYGIGGSGANGNTITTGANGTANRGNGGGGGGHSSGGARNGGAGGSGIVILKYTT